MAAIELLERSAPRPWIDAPGRMAPANEPPPARDLASLTLSLGSAIADAADADQWAIAIVGVEGTGAPDFEELVPRAWLEILNGGQPARYRMTLVLTTEGCDLGIVRLGTVRPTGFTPLDVARARAAADVAARALYAAAGGGADDAGHAA